MQSLELLHHELEPEAIDERFSAIVDALDEQNGTLEQREALQDTPFLNKPERPGDLYCGQL